MLKVILAFIPAFCVGQVSFSGCYISGAMINPGSVAGCGNGSNYCNLAALYVPAFTPSACGTSTASGGVSHTKSTSYILPAGCTATVEAEFKKRNSYGAPVNPSGNGCFNCGMDAGSPDALYITQSGGAVAFQGSTMSVNAGTCSAYPAAGSYSTAAASLSAGCSNGDGYVKMELTGGTFTIGGASNRADEIITFTVNLSGTCGPSCTNVLPVDFLSFNGKPGETGIELQWQVANESRLSHYLVEKCSDGINWQPMFTAFPQSNYRNNITYYITDESPFAALNYYRLSSADDDGSRRVHRVISVMYGSINRYFILTQNEDQVIVHCPGDIACTLLLKDATGRLVKKIKTAPGETVEISKSEIPKGLLLLSCEEFEVAAPLKVIVY